MSLLLSSINWTAIPYVIDFMFYSFPFGYYVNFILSFLPTCVASCSNGQIKLIEGPYDNWGRVEICSNQRWETISRNNNWQYQETRVACNALGYDGVYTLCNVRYMKVAMPQSQ